MTTGDAPLLVRQHGEPDVAIGDTDGRVIYAVGDIHGCYDHARVVLAGITEDVKRLSPAARPLIVMCGDYVDRGPRSADVVTMLLWLERHAPCETVFLRGNHEAMLLRFIDSPVTAQGWLTHGGDQTLMSYEVNVDPERRDAAYLTRLRDAFLDALPASHLAFLGRLPLTYRCGDYIFVHAGLRPGIALKRQVEDDCLWIRDEFLLAEHDFGAIVVHGHSWTDDRPTLAAGRVGIDTGAYQTGVLSAARLDGTSVSFIQARSATDRDGGQDVEHPRIRELQ